MAHFYGSMTGNRKPRTCCGTKNSGLSAHLRGWNVGVKIEIEYDESIDADRIFIYQTGGSNNDARQELLAELHHEPKQE